MLGEEPDWSLLGPLTQLDATVVAAGLRAGTGNGLLSWRAEGLGWHHSLTRTAVLTGMLPTERAELTDRLADLLLARAATATTPWRPTLLAAGR